jgi:prepilin-type N-terminal cleavage/methylation domain-containing protein
MSPRIPSIPRQSRLRRGFTLIELLVVIAIIGILAAILIPAIGSVRERAKVTQSTSNLRQIGAAMNLYANENNNKFPPMRSFEEGEIGVVWFVALMPYLVDPNKKATEMNSSQITDVYRCPVYREWWEETNPNAEASDWNQLGYAMSYRMVFDSGWPFPGVGDGAQKYSAPRSRIKNPGKTVLIGPSNSWNLNFQRYAIPSFVDPTHGITRAHRHGDFALYLMTDGSVHPIEATVEALLPYVTN